MSSTVKRVFDLLKYSAEQPKEDFACGKENGKWTKYSTDEFCTAVDNLSRGLIKKGIVKAGRVAVMSHNRPEWNIADFAANQIGAYQIPLYPTLAENDIKFILKDADISIIFVADEDLYKKVKPCIDAVNPSIKIYTFNDVAGAENWNVLLKDGATADEINLDEYKDNVSPEDILTIIYTSGTTGTPKGVMLTHNNLVANFLNSAVVMPPNVDKGLSFLPLSHIFERMIIYLYIFNRTSIYYAESMDTIVADIQYVKPNAFSTVPRLLEKVYDKIMEKGKALTGIKKSIFFWSVALAENYKIDAGAWYNFQLGIARKLVFKKWQEALGGQIIVIVSGGAALNPRLAKIFWAAGMPVFEGYGLTETSPVITVNRSGGTMFGTVGEVIEGVEVKIAPDGEVLTRGHQVMKGYYNKPDLTAEVIDADGWFHTGDIGELIDGKFLKITDRKKEMFKTAGGKYVAPQVLENKYKESIFVEQIMVLGENRKFPSALIVPNFVTLKTWCERHGIAFTTKEEIIQNEKVLTKFAEVLEGFNSEFGKWEQVKRFALLPKEWTIDGGELTPKLSLKRKVITEKNNAIIEKIYKDAENYKA
ncbi:long-chain fatty acid--CoA ligase [Pedobacter changchengzhani]|uniref:Long-chain fatty acid--CoA ligase n=1 Tax=Pedobacter changchengzhani TaxID=2529274 RepID=A0A4R5MJL9_9SPHI|nr:long-chain fatty acid--CoA ligase [Pedobacter changchengzhani]TDG35395.1 long-chain fatty acid--CoA ligase [Pedobacter changchengzhani]